MAARTTPLYIYTAWKQIVYFEKKRKTGTDSSVLQTQDECSYIQQSEPVSQDAEKDFWNANDSSWHIKVRDVSEVQVNVFK